MVRIGFSYEMGREVISTKLIPKGTIIEVCELLVLSQEDTKSLNETALKFYTFKYNETQDCLVLGCGEIFNHDEKPNVSYTLTTKDDRKVMMFKALTDIPCNSQLFIDYTADTKVDASQYVNKNMVGV